MNIPHLLYPFICQHRFHVLTIVDNAAMNIGVHLSFQNMGFSGFFSRSSMARLSGSTIFCF